MATFEVHRATNTLMAPSGSSSVASHTHLSGHGPAHATASIMFEDDENEEDGMDVEDEEGGQSSSSKRSQSHLLATAGQPIASTSTFMRGHGAYIGGAAPGSGLDGASSIISSLCGLVSRTNRLVSVAALKSRYAPEVGDLVVGRITEVQAGNRRWRVDVGARQDAILALSSVNLPGGIQRRKLESDELQMRTFFAEGDLLVAEVQAAFGDGSVGLHTRSLRYGKLRNGALAVVPPVLIRRLKSHFVELSQAQLEVTMGLNGFIWVAPDDAEAKKSARAIQGRDTEGVYSDENVNVIRALRRRITRVVDVLSILAANHLPISDLSLSRTYDLSIALAPLQTEAAGDDDLPGGLTSDVVQVIVDEAKKAESSY
ncbi:hypothetical protein FA10DRAFT_265276 [Acaromyces ingoldii]|uniref:Uncharacterized protein n=1 Tax=Acaromyces ingoldii TaxID=215250 RepID=A0A316YPV7_9BASI|nr:hypothetical protein FA10DRAFT_265276 [Acaromyces ingoldii]PWN91417.1 hypothetical protein FA10DRAFT_265276 [Acaromyces ingoldii]